MEVSRRPEACYKHHLVVRPTCDVGLRGPGMRRQKTEIDEEDRVIVLGDSLSRFMPQWDSQILGSRNTHRITKDYDNPPKPLPPPELQFHSCSDCGLTWLVGKSGERSASSHPSHHALFHKYSGTSRSLIVHIDGACPSNGLSNAKAGIGIFFGQGSKFNVSCSLELPGTPTNQKAELHALIRALDVVKEQVVQERSQLVAQALGTSDAEETRDARHFRLVVVTDSSYIVECMCSHFKKWTEDSRGVLWNKRGKAVTNSDEFIRVRRGVQALSMVGVQVVYYHVNRKHNKAADTLARAGIANKAVDTLARAGIAY